MNEPASATGGAALPADERPVDDSPVHTAELPATPVRDRNVPATAWIEAPEALRALGDDIDQRFVTYKRRIGPWLLWRAGPAARSDARYMALRADDLDDTHTFRLYADGTGQGVGPSGATHTRFRSWKEDLRDAPQRRSNDAGGGP